MFTSRCKLKFYICNGILGFSVAIFRPRHSGSCSVSIVMNLKNLHCKVENNTTYVHVASLSNYNAYNESDWI